MKTAFGKFEIVTADHDSAFGTRILIDGVEQTHVKELHLHIVVGQPTQLEMTQFLTGKAAGKGQIKQVTICPSCEKALDEEVSILRESNDPGVSIRTADASALDSEWEVNLPAPRLDKQMKS